MAKHEPDMVLGTDRAELEAQFPEVNKRYLQMPHAEKGKRIGLFGGSFNPPHEGHMLVAEAALRKLELDQIWWMVTPGNPLKDANILAPLKDRLSASEALSTDQRIKVTALEAAYNVRFTADTLKIITKANPEIAFVWIMGADNLGQFHQWQHWRDIADLMPIAVIDRPGATDLNITSVTAKALSPYRIDESEANKLALMEPPAWVFLHGTVSDLSSTALRKKADKRKPAV